MTAVLIDANVLLDVMTEDAHWSAWSAEAIERVADRYRLVINPVIYAEIASGFATMAELDARLGDFRRLTLPNEAGFVAGRAFVEYRRNGGVRTSPPPDFYLGAHAAIAGLKLLTRDAKRYRGYFPSVLMISP